MIDEWQRRASNRGRPPTLDVRPYIFLWVAMKNSYSRWRERFMGASLVDPRDISWNMHGRLSTDRSSRSMPGAKSFIENASSWKVHNTYQTFVPISFTFLFPPYFPPTSISTHFPCLWFCDLWLLHFFFFFFLRLPLSKWNLFHRFQLRVFQLFVFSFFRYSNVVVVCWELKNHRSPSDDHC